MYVSNKNKEYVMTTLSTLKSWFENFTKPAIERHLKTIEKAIAEASNKNNGYVMTALSTLKTWFETVTKPVIEKHLEIMEKAIAEAQNILISEGQKPFVCVKIVDESRPITVPSNTPSNTPVDPSVDHKRGFRKFQPIDTSVDYEEGLRKFQEEFLSAYRKGKSFYYHVDNKATKGMNPRVKGEGVSVFIAQNMEYDEESVISLDEFYSRYKKWIEKTDFSECKKNRVTLFFDRSKVRSLKGFYRGKGFNKTITFLRGIKFKSPNGRKRACGCRKSGCNC